MYQLALDAGIPPFLFWDYSLRESMDVIESYNRTTIQQIKMQATHNQIMADMVGHAVGDGKMKQLWDYYPDIFEAERKIYEKQQQLELIEKRRNMARKRPNNED